MKELFADDDDAVCMANGWLEEQAQQFFYNRIESEHWRNTRPNCILVEGC